MIKDRTIEAFESTVQASHEWVNEYAEHLGQDHPPLAFRCLRAALHVIRDRLPIAEAAALAAQLPMLLRGAFYENWRPGHAPGRVHTADEVYELVARELAGGLGAPPRDVMRAAFTLLERRVDAGLLAKMRPILPEAVRTLWASATEPARASAPIDGPSATR